MFIGAFVSSFAPLRETLLTLVLALDGVDLGDALAMAFLGDLGRQPGRDDVAHLLAVDRLAAERQHIRVVVLARVARYFYRVTRCGAHTRHLVRRHRTADTRAVNYNPEIRSAIRHRARHSVCEVRIINRL